MGDESAIVAGSGVASEGEVKAAIGFRRTMACISNIAITLLVARYSCRQEILEGLFFLPNGPKQLSFENRMMSD